MKKLLLLHGALGSAEQLEPLASRLKDSFEVEVFEFSGHGQKPARGPFRIEGFSKELLDYLEERKLDKVSVFGYSMGGYVALYLAGLQPGLFRQILTLATKFDWSPEIAARESRMLDPEKIESKVPAFAAMLKDRHGLDRWKQVCRETADSLLALGKNPLLTADFLGRIDIPVTICRGDVDKMVGQDESEWAAAQVANGHFVGLPDTPHPFEQLDQEMLVSLICEKLGG